MRRWCSTLDRGAVVFVGKGERADALDPFRKRLRAAHANIESVATEMSAAYTPTVRQRSLSIQPRVVTAPCVATPTR